MKYINDEEHIQADFGYNRLNERYKTCVTCRGRQKQYCSGNPRQSTVRRHKLLNQVIDDDNQTCTKCYKMQHVNEFTENEKQMKYCTSCRNEQKEKRHVILNQPIDCEDHQTCTTCLQIKHANEFTENDKQFKTCTSCRDKPKQQLLLIKEKLVGEKTKVCCYCNIEKI